MRLTQKWWVEIIVDCKSVEEIDNKNCRKATVQGASRHLLYSHVYLLLLWGALMHQYQQNLNAYVFCSCFKLLGDIKSGWLNLVQEEFLFSYPSLGDWTGNNHWRKQYEPNSHFKLQCTKKSI